MLLTVILVGLCIVAIGTELSAPKEASIPQVVEPEIQATAQTIATINIGITPADSPQKKVRPQLRQRCDI